MKLSESVKPISFLKAHASEIIRDLSKNHKTIVITHNGEAKAVVQDLASYEEMKESLALLKILAQSQVDKKRGGQKPLSQAFQNLRERIKTVDVP